MSIRRSFPRVVSLVAMALLFSIAPLAFHAHAAPAAKAKKHVFHHPNLTGQSVTFVVAAPPQISDTPFDDMVQIVKSWGASVKLVNVDGEDVAMQDLVSGGADVGEGQVDAAENAGAMIFGPKQPHVDYYMAGSKSLKKVSQLPGHSFAVSNTAGLENLMYKLELKKYKIPTSKVPEVISGSANVRVQALLAGRIDATFVHFDGWLLLKGKGFHVLTTVAKDIPNLADSFTLAMPSWLASHRSMAIAIDEAYLKAAQTFHNSPTRWAAIDGQYTSNADPPGVVSGLYKQYLKANLWPDTGAAYNTAVLKFNEKVVKSVGAINSPKPLSAWANLTDWNAAVKAVLGKKAK